MGSLDNLSVSEDAYRYCIGVRGENDSNEKILVTRKEDSINELRRQSLNISGIKKDIAINYGLWMPPKNGKQGKFLKDERPVQDYIELFVPIKTSTLNNIDSEGMIKLEKEVNWLKLLYKSRFYESDLPESKIKKINTKMNQKSLFDAIKNEDLGKVEKLLARGLDPNFQFKSSGETPLTIVMIQKNPREMILKLIEGGAHIDFRSADSLTPLHKAAINGNYEAMQTLLDLGQNPNCRDSKNLTPLYHGVSVDSPGKCSHCLLYDHAVLGVQDELGLQEIHQACRFGRTQHLDNLINYGANLNALTKKSNTPLHICVVANQEECLRLLLIRGADKSIVNISGQTPFQCALLTNRNHIAEIIENFDSSSILPIREPPLYNERRRPILNGPRAAVLNAEMRKRQKEIQEANIRDRRKLSLDMSSKYQMSYQSNFMSLSKPDLSKIDLRKKEKVYFIKNGKIMNYEYVDKCEESISEGLKQRSYSNGHLDARRDELENTIYKGKKYLGVLKNILLNPNPNGYGFVLKGSKTASPKNKNLPTQYLTNIQLNSPAYYAGIRNGDYVLEINDTNVSEYSHDQTVGLIKDNMQAPIRMVLLSQSIEPRIMAASSSVIDTRASSSSDVKEDDSESNRKIIFVKDIVKKREPRKVQDMEDYQNHDIQPFKLPPMHHETNPKRTQDKIIIIRNSIKRSLKSLIDDVKPSTLKNETDNKSETCIDEASTINKNIINNNSSDSNAKSNSSIDEITTYNSQDDKTYESSEKAFDNKINNNNSLPNYTISNNNIIVTKSTHEHSPMREVKIVTENEEESVLMKKKSVKFTDNQDQIITVKLETDILINKHNPPILITRAQSEQSCHVLCEADVTPQVRGQENNITELKPPPTLPKPKNPRKPYQFTSKRTTQSQTSLPFSSADELIRQKNLLRPLN